MMQIIFFISCQGATVCSLLSAGRGGGPNLSALLKGQLRETGANRACLSRMTGVEAAGGFRAGATRAARTGRRQPKGTTSKAAQFTCAQELLFHHKVEVTAPALPKRRLCQQGGFANKAALPTRWFCQGGAILELCFHMRDASSPL